MRFSFGNYLTDTVRAATVAISADAWVARSTSRAASRLRGTARRTTRAPTALTATSGDMLR